MPTHPHLFDVQEVLGLKGDGHSLNRHLIPWRWVVADICPHSKCHWLGLEEDENQRVKSQWDVQLPDWGGDYGEVGFVNCLLKHILYTLLYIR